MSKSGWNKPAESGGPAERKVPSSGRGALAGSFVVILAGVILWAVFPARTADEKRAGNKSGLIREASGDSPAKTATAVKEGSKGVAAAVKVPDADVGKKSAMRELADIPVPDSLPKPPEKKPHVFDNACDQLLAMATSGGDSNMPPFPIANGMEKDFMKALEKEIVISDDDSEQVKELKQRVIDARAKMKELLAEGKTFRQVLEEHREQVNFSADVRRETMMEARKILDSGDVEGAKNYVTMMNLALQQIGVQEINMPLTQKERLARRQQRALERQNLREQPNLKEEKK